MRKLGWAAAVISVGLGFLAGGQAAQATDFCVPNSAFASCPGGAEVRASLEAAMNDAATRNDGQPDTVHLPAGTLTDPDSISTTAGGDDLTVIGAGRTETTLTSSSSSNIYLINLNGGAREITFKDLEILVPASFPNSGGAGAAVQSNGDHFESVNLVTENVSSDPPQNSDSSGFFNIINGGSFIDVRVFGRNGARFSQAFNSASCGSGTISIERTSIASARNGITTNCLDVPVQIDRANFSVSGSALLPANGGRITASNVLIESGDEVPIDMYTSKGDGDTILNLDHATVVATGDASLPAIRATVANTGTATSSVQVNVSNSLIAGFAAPWTVSAPNSGTLGNVDMTVSYSQFNGTGGGGGDVNVDQSEGNIDGQPGFVDITDYRLAAGSPAIDSGNANAATPTVDLEGETRPVDGNCDGTPIRDMGAYEFIPPPVLCLEEPDTTAPKLSKPKLKYRFGKGGKLQFNLSEKASVVAIFKPVPKKAKGKKRKALRISRQVKVGVNVFKLKKRALKLGRYKLILRATDAAGNSGKPLTRKIRVKPMKRKK